MGTFGADAKDLIRDLGSRLRAVTGEPRSATFLTQRISIAIQRGNAASVLATIPKSPNFYEIFNL